MRKGAVLVLALLLGLVPGAYAQISTGNIYGTVSDESGAVLPGATVTVTGESTGARSSTSGSDGAFRFLNLDPGSYKLAVSLTGFTTVNRQVSVTTGGNVSVTFGLKVATVEETVTVTAETPVVDTKKVGTNVTVSRAEMEKTPQARDPWALMRTVPGILVDRVNIGGNESGQQANFAGKGSTMSDATWNMDGISITDMAALASPTYYDFDAFEEINFSTGGNDIRIATGGIAINFVTKRGTNSFHGGVRGFFTHDDLQSSNIGGTTLAKDKRLCLNPPACTSFADKADHIQQIADYGFDIGGPIIKDKLWFWGSYGKQNIRLVRTNQTADKTILEDFNGKLSWQASSSDMLTVVYFNGKKSKFGRAGYGAGFGLQEPDSALWNQGGVYPGGPHGLVKVEDNHVFSPDFVVNVKYGYYGTGFSLAPRGGLTGDTTLDFVQGVVVGTSIDYHTVRPEHNVTVDANYFRGNHEFKFGFGYKRYPVTSTTTFPGTKVQGRLFAPSSGYALIYRDGVLDYLGNYVSGYVGDTYTKNRLTLNAGVRYDRQTSKNNPTTAVANPLFPNLMPAVTSTGAGDIKFNDVSPRVSLSYALDSSRKTLVRASYARYASQLAAADPTLVSSTYYSYLAYYWTDLNGDKKVQKNEVDLGSGIIYYAAGMDLANQNLSTNKINADYKAKHDNEFIVGIDRELAPNFAVSAAYTYRRTRDVAGDSRIGLTRADYTCGNPTTARGFTNFGVCSPSVAKVLAAKNGVIRGNRPDYYRKFSGFELSAVKRLSNKWMGRLAFSYNDWTEHFDGGVAGSKGVQNPTRTQRNPLDDGGQVAPRSGGSGKGAIFYNAKWQASANALYQLPWDFEISANMYARQGYPRPIRINKFAGFDGTLSTLACPTGTSSANCHVDNERYPNLVDLDVRLAKNIKIGSASVVASAEAFNVLNKNTTLNKNFTASSSAFNRLDEVLSPRIIRFGLRLNF